MKLERFEIFADQSDISEVLRGAKRGNVVLKRGHWSLSPADVVVLHLDEISLFYGVQLICICNERESFVFAQNEMRPIPSPRFRKRMNVSVANISEIGQVSNMFVTIAGEERFRYLQYLQKK